MRSIFSMNLRKFRRLSNMSQMDLASEADLALNFISDLENGKKWFSPETLGKLSAALKIPPYQFFASSPKYSSNGVEMLSMCNDIQESLEKMMDEYRSRILMDDSRETEISGSAPMPFLDKSSEEKSKG